MPNDERWQQANVSEKLEKRVCLDVMNLTLCLDVVRLLELVVLN